MDDLARVLVTSVFLFILAFLVGVVVTILVIIDYIKRKKNIPRTIKSNGLLVLIAYVILAIVFFIFVDWGIWFAVSFLPLISIIMLILLEILSIFTKREEKNN